ncbi:MAG: prepilin-type N-terminal cleavage/methylation domain-containing protein [Oscillospiraceae bacterium]|nr:prepilin-type N-terminal cleavage/methylation domain-containing protein [Oscillospiraceae bacterium]
MRNNKGFTLIEVVLGIALTSIVLLAVGSMLVTAVVNNKDIANKSVVQQNSELALAELRTTCFDASQIMEIKDTSGHDAINETGRIPLGEMVIRRAVINGDNFAAPSEILTFYKFDDTAHTFGFKDDVYSNYGLVSQYIDSIYIEPLPSDGTTTFKDCLGIEVSIKGLLKDTAIKKKSEVNVVTQIYFRNSDFKV